MRLLIVEDNERMAALIADGLQRRGFVCDVAHDLAQADAAMGSASYDAIILDLGLPADFVIADLSLADWGRKEIKIAETEMPGLMAIRRLAQQFT